MKGPAAASLIVVALIVGAGIGYWSNSNHVGTTEIITKTYTTAKTYTITAPSATGTQTSSEMICVLTEYSIWMIEIIQSSTTTYGTTTQSNGVQTYVTTTSAERTIGYETTITTMTYTSTITGVIARWNATVCTYVPFPGPLS